MQNLNDRIQSFYTTRTNLEAAVEQVVFQQISAAFTEPIDAVTFEAWASEDESCFRLRAVETQSGVTLQDTEALTTTVVAHLTDDSADTDPQDLWEELVYDDDTWTLLKERATRCSDRRGNFRLSSDDVAQAAARRGDALADVAVEFGPDDTLVITVTSDRPVRLWRRSETILHDTERPTQGHVTA